MSAYSDWKCGAISYDEFRSEMEYEARQDKYFEEQQYLESLRDEFDEDEEHEGDE